MSMKKTDLEKNKAKKLDGKMKSGIAPSRFNAWAMPSRSSFSIDRLNPSAFRRKMAAEA